MYNFFRNWNPQNIIDALVTRKPKKKKKKSVIAINISEIIIERFLSGK